MVTLTEHTVRQKKKPLTTQTVENFNSSADKAKQISYRKLSKKKQMDKMSMKRDQRAAFFIGRKWTQEHNYPTESHKPTTAESCVIIESC